jgi:hypothetical protein
MQRTLCFEVVIDLAYRYLSSCATAGSRREQLLLDPKLANLQEAARDAKPIYAPLMTADAISRIPALFQNQFTGRSFKATNMHVHVCHD